MSPVDPPEYLYAVYVSVPLLALVLTGLLLYICCIRKHRFNWFETGLLHEASNGAEQRTFNFFDEKSCFNTHFSPNFYAFGPRSSLVSGSLLPSHLNSNCGLISTAPPIITCVYQNKAGGTPYQALLREDSTASQASSTFRRPSNTAANAPSAAVAARPVVDLPALTVASNVRYVTLRARSEDSMGSNPSSPTSEENSFASNCNRRSSRHSMGRTHSQQSGSDTPSTPHHQFQIGGGSSGALVSANGAHRRGSSGAIIGGEAEQFWVPPTVLHKKRAQSLIPHVLDYGSSTRTLSPTNTLNSDKQEDKGSPCRTPSSSNSLQEMAVHLPVSERLSESVMLVQVPSGQAHRRRRASMQDALDHTKINASLYSDRPLPVQRQQSIGSIEEENLGAVNFSVLYDQEQGLITVHLIQACDLVPRDFSGTADPYCRLCLLPMSRNQIQSKVHRKTLSPEFNEEFVFDVSPHEIDDMKLQILLYDYDQFSRDECIGEVVQPLAPLDLEEKVTMWKGFTTRTNRQAEVEAIGDLMFSMAYLSSAERLTVVVVKGRHLHQKEESKASYSPFVKISMIVGGKRVKKKKTSSKRNTPNPVWNEAIVFSVPKESIDDVQFEFVVYNDNLLSNNEALGKVVIGPKSSGEELSHWLDVMSSKNAMAMWHRIRPMEP